MNCPGCRTAMESCKPFSDYACPKCGLCGPINVICWVATMKRRHYVNLDTIATLRGQIRRLGGRCG